MFWYGCIWRQFLPLLEMSGGRDDRTIEAVKGFFCGLGLPPTIVKRPLAILER